MAKKTTEITKTTMMTETAAETTKTTTDTAMETDRKTEILTRQQELVYLLQFLKNNVIAKLLEMESNSSHAADNKKQLSHVLIVFSVNVRIKIKVF